MGRQLFLHHYLPAHLASALVAGALIEFIFNVEPTGPSFSSNPASPSTPTQYSALPPSDSSATPRTPNTPSSQHPQPNHNSEGSSSDPDYPRTRNGSILIPVRQRLVNQSLLAAWSAAIVILVALAWSFIFFSPLTYGQPPLNVKQVLARKWLGYDFHFAK